MNSSPNLPYYLGFNLVPGIGPARLARLIDRLGSPADAWRAGPADLAAAGVDSRGAAALQAARRSLDLDAELARVRRAGLDLLCVEDPGYPALLAAAPAAPPLLYLRGALAGEDAWAVAVVGTRTPSAYGREAAYRLAHDLARAGVTIVSGLALGVDAVAHQAALDAGGRTLAVLACGADLVYPERHRQLAGGIVRSGAIISDYPLGSRPTPLSFPPRNRIISGLSLATVVVEAGEKSGALITVEFALDQGREVFAVPGTIFSPRSAGCNRLIRSGATLVTSADDILEALSLGRSEAQQEARAALPDDPLEAAVLAHLDREPRPIDEVGRACGLDAPSTAAALAMLELKGLARQAGPLQYVRA